METVTGHLICETNILRKDRSKHKTQVNLED
jgi:hypothetical protein